MKKIVVSILIFAMAVSLALAGCSVTAVSVKTGLGAVISIAKSASATADAGALAEADVTTAAVTLGADGKILGVKFDVLQSKVNFDAAGQLTTDIAVTPQTKVELKEGYGMKKASAIGKEWYEQAAALEDWMVGKTIDQVMGMKVSDQGTTAEADLTSSVTVHVGDFLSAVKKAVDNARDFGVKVTGKTKTGLGHAVSIAKSTSATADAAALAETDDTFAAVTVDENGKIVGVLIDTAQVKINVDATGAVTTDTTAAPKTKVELGDEYGMKKASAIGKEWYEQIAALGQWMIGKTVDQVKGMKVSDQGTAAEADLTSSVTIHVADYLTAVQKAVANAD